MGQPTGVVAIVIVGGGPLTSQAIEVVEAVAADSYIVAADSGLDFAVEADLAPSALVGDLDSISAAGRMWAYEHAINIKEHAPDKDLTDTELALAHALKVPNVRELVLLSGSAGPERRIDHLLGIILALGHPSLAALDTVRAVIGTTHFQVLHPGHTALLTIEPGQQFSILAMHGPCTGVTISGARWPLADATLTATEARGLSNEANLTPDTNPEVSVQTGVLTVVIP
ncbi:thiamine diphosphokinase [soil metagenome]